MGTLYIVGVPWVDLDDLTQRALRILRGATLVVGDDVGYARRLLDHCDIASPLVELGERTALEALQAGDVALIVVGWLAGPSSPGYQLVCAAIELGFPVVSVPGPAFPITSLVISGLPSDSFIYLGELPRESSERSDMLASVAVERRTVVVVVSFSGLTEVLSDLQAALGDRSLAVVATSARGAEVIWRGSLGEPPGRLPDPLTSSRCALVIAGAQPEVMRWDERQLRAEIRMRLAQGLGVRETSHQLAVESSWPRREIYRLAVQIAQSGSGWKENSNTETEQQRP